MFNQSDFQLNDIVKTKKKHPCGCETFKIIQLGIDFKLECTQCSRVVILPRQKALKAITKRIEKE